MPPDIELVQKANGLNLQYDPLERPEGSLLRAKNVVCNREGLVESRRGLDRYGPPAVNRWKHWTFDNTLDAYVGGGTLVDSGAATYQAGLINQCVKPTDILTSSIMTMPDAWSVALWAQYTNTFPLSMWSISKNVFPSERSWGISGTAALWKLFWSIDGSTWAGSVSLSKNPAAPTRNAS